MRFADLKNDFVFKRIFAHHPELTRALLNHLLEREGEAAITELTVIPPEQAPLVAGAKLSILDVRCRDAAGHLFVVEMQLLHVAGFVNRVVYNACKAYVSQLPAGGQYPDLAPVVALSICDFALWPDDARRAAGLGPVPMVSRWRLTEQRSGAVGLDQVQYAFLELPKLPDGPPRTDAERWAALFRRAPGWSEVPAELPEGPQREALGLANQATFTAGELEAYCRVADEIEQARQLERDALGAGLAKGLAKGLAEGRAEGLRQGIRTVASVLGIELDAERETFLAVLDTGGLASLVDRLQSERRWPQR